MKNTYSVAQSLLLTTLVSLSLTSFNTVQAAQPLTEIVVTAELLPRNALEIPSSTTVIDQKMIEARSAQHLEDLLNLAPNVNYASGASRGRFIQIRGIGERSEFQEPIINSVGILLDGIDLTGIANAASSLDIQQVEVLRGPQGTLHGANALAGLINLVSNKPSSEPLRRVTAAIEEYGGLEFGGVLSEPISETSAYRLAFKHYESDGFNEDLFLNRDDTSRINETTARARYTATLSDKFDIDVSLFLADIDNGYDAFSLDNTRETYSDEPGIDTQDTKAISLKALYAIRDRLNFEGLISAADSQLEYSYDEDWSHLGICENTACDSDLFGFDWFYSSTDNYFRDNQNLSIDLRMLSNEATIPWVLGLYHRDQSIDLERIYTFAESDFSSSLGTQNTALYGQVDYPVDSHWTVSAGLRLERRNVDYRDNSGAVVTPHEDLWGGRLALEYRAESGAYYYALASHGYKPGGFNLDGSIATELREFDTETMTNYELGLKRSFFDGALQLQISLFWQERDAIQSKQSIVTSIATGVIGGNCPCSFTDFTDNATSGSNRGVELEMRWEVNEALDLVAAAGLLDATFDSFLTFEHVDADRENGEAFNLVGREQAHAPSYQWLLAANFDITPNWQLSGSIEGKDDFYFSDRHEERSDAYQLINLEIAYQSEKWRIALYGKNLNDELVKTRGFGSFGNDPRKFYQTEVYNQFAAARRIGLKANLEF